MGFNSPSTFARIGPESYSSTPRVQEPTHEGGTGFRYNPEEELYHLVASSLLSGDTFYEPAAARTKRLGSLIDEVSKSNPEFLPALAWYARHKLNLRTTPTVLVAEALQRKIPGADQAADLVWLRGDEHLEALAYLSSQNQKRTKAFLRAVSRRLNRLTQRQTLRYACDGKGKSFSQKGAAIIAHPTPVSEQQSALFAYVVKGWSELTDAQKALLPTLASVKAGEQDASWESLVSREGSTSETWAKAVPTMGYMALLRNLRNFVEKGLPESVAQDVACRLADPDEVRRSRQLPFRFLSAYKALASTSIPSPLSTMFGNALHMAMEISAANVPELPGRTLVLVDVSGSMNTPISAKSTVFCSEVAAVLGAILARRAQGGELWAFGSRAMPITFAPGETLLALSQRLPPMGNIVGHGTEIMRAMQAALFRAPDPSFDRIVIVTDMQTWASPFCPVMFGDIATIPSSGTFNLLETYRKAHPKTVAYGLNVGGYQTSAFQKVGQGALTAEVGGWSESIITMMLELERNDPVHQIMMLWNGLLPEIKTALGAKVLGESDEDESESASDAVG